MAETLVVVIDEVGLRLPDLVGELRSVGQVSFGSEQVVTVCRDNARCYIVANDPALEDVSRTGQPVPFRWGVGRPSASTTDRQRWRLPW
jgi:hypothetical protein